MITRCSLFAVVLLLAAGCGGDPAAAPADGGGQGGTGGAGQSAGTGGAGGTVQGTGGGAAAGTGGAASGTGGAAAGTGGMVGTGGSGPAGTGGAGPAAPFCAQFPQGSYTACGFQGGAIAGGYEWISRFKDGLTCASCVEKPGKQVVGCKMFRTVATQGITDPVLCVQACTDCCYTRANTACDSDADCCLPLRCKPGTPGQNKTCQQ